VKEGQSLTHGFKILNRGKSPLRIVVERARSLSCSVPTKVFLANKPIPPGGSTTYGITFQTSGFSGPVTFERTLYSNDPAHLEFKLKANFNIIREVDVIPDNVEMFPVNYKTPQKASVKILGRPGLPLKVLSAQSAKGVVTVAGFKSYSEGSPQREGATFDILLPATTAIGFFEDEVLVKTDDIQKTEIKIPVAGEVVGRIRYNPLISFVHPQGNSPVRVRLLADHPEDLAIRSIRSERHIVRAYIKRVRGWDGKDQYSLIVKRVRGFPEGGEGEDHIFHETNDPVQSQLKIDVKISK
jgi:hypothetical protein